MRLGGGPLTAAHIIGFVLSDQSSMAAFLVRPALASGLFTRLSSKIRSSAVFAPGGVPSGRKVSSPAQLQSFELFRLYVASFPFLPFDLANWSFFLFFFLFLRTCIDSDHRLPLRWRRPSPRNRLLITLVSTWSRTRPPGDTFYSKRSVLFASGKEFPFPRMSKQIPDILVINFFSIKLTKQSILTAPCDVSPHFLSKCA